MPRFRMYIADFETTVDEDTINQKETEVWAYGISKLYDGTEDVTIGNNIGDFFSYFCHGKRAGRKIIYFTNLKFDGSFILDFLIRQKGFKAAYDEDIKEYDKKDIKPKTFTTVITDLGIWYNIIVNYEGYILEFRDTLKILPFSVKDLGPAFDCKFRKLELEYKGNMKAGGEITPEQRSYIRNDILVPKEALEKFFNEIGMADKPPLTIGQHALNDFKSVFTKEEYENYFPNLAQIPLDEALWDSPNVDAYVRRSYLGGWCYVNERYSGIEQGHTKVCDVNSLYPSVMRDHNNPMPVGLPILIRDPKEMLNHKNDYYFIRFKCKFSVLDGYLPFIQLKYDYNYRKNENIFTTKTSRAGEDIAWYKPTLTLSKTMFEMFIKSYKVEDFEFLDMIAFNTEEGLFDSYIDKWIQKKIEAGKSNNKVKRTIAKLMLNSLYGKFGKNPENCFKVPTIPDDDEEGIDYPYDIGPDGKPVYIPIASAITSYARRFTVTAAVENIDCFRYSDTDSIHLVCDKDYEPKGVTIHDSALSCWKIENETEHSIFVRQKTYIEWTGEDYDIKACGMPDRCKMLIAENLKGNLPFNDELFVDDKQIKLSHSEVEFMNNPIEISDFRQGLTVPGKLLPKIIKGGTILQEVEFTIN